METYFSVAKKNTVNEGSSVQKTKQKFENIKNKELQI